MSLLDLAWIAGFSVVGAVLGWAHWTWIRTKLDTTTSDNVHQLQGDGGRGDLLSHVVLLLIALFLIGTNALVWFHYSAAWPASLPQSRVQWDWLGLLLPMLLVGLCYVWGRSQLHYREASSAELEWMRTEVTRTRAALEKRPPDARLYLHMCELYRSLGLIEEAKTALKEAASFREVDSEDVKSLAQLLAIPTARRK